MNFMRKYHNETILKNHYQRVNKMITNSTQNYKKSPIVSSTNINKDNIIIKSNVMRKGNIIRKGNGIIK